MKSKAEETFALHVRVLHLPEPVREYRFFESRRWRIDFAWPDLKVAVEIEGGTHTGGRHVRGDGFEKDCEKYNCLSEMGWRLFRYTSRQVLDGRAIEQMKRILG